MLSRNAHKRTNRCVAGQVLERKEKITLMEKATFDEYGKFVLSTTSTQSLDTRELTDRLLELREYTFPMISNFWTHKISKIFGTILPY